ncbi:MAG: hypothetical protein MR902_04860 [Campylobacter sp.]|nr:hypothetical protein [Campylobacter sp.]
MTEQNRKKTFWPYGILLSIFAIACACVATVIVSLDYPVHMDDFYFNSYQKVDENYNAIQISQQNFDEKFAINLVNDQFNVDEPVSIKFNLTDKNLVGYDALNVEVLITRPDSSEFDKRPGFNIKDGILEITPFSVEKLGRWQILLKLSDKKDTGFYKFEIFVSDVKR